MKRLIVILFTFIFICKITGADSLLLSKNKITVICDSEPCENETGEIEKNIDDYKIIPNYHSGLIHSLLVLTHKATFAYHANYANQIHKILFSPPPEFRI